MNAFNRERQPSLSQWMQSSIQASILLDQRGNVSFTNLDEISGKVIVKCAKDITVNSITVKLEGESRTRLQGMPLDGIRQGPKVELEHHKILYRLQTLLPSAEVAAVAGGLFTLPAGTHEYPFKLKLPFNNACHTPATALPGIQMGVSSHGFEVTKQASRHVKKTLPPTLTGFPGEAEISYYVKATIQRQGLWKENPRAYSAFQLLPIEPPRPPLTGGQVFARQQHVFEAEGKRTGKSSFFGAMKPWSPTSSTAELAPSFSLDMRIPEPAILTCNQPLPLAIVITKMNACSEVFYVQSLQISLISFTRIRAHDLERIEQGSWVITSRSNMGMKVGNESDPEGTETTLDNSAWGSVPLPNAVAPSFETCNIARYYKVEVRIGLSYGGGAFGTTKPQQIVLPLRLDTQVYSGIEPPKEVLARMAARSDTMSQPDHTASAQPVVVTNDQKTPAYHSPAVASPQASTFTSTTHHAQADTSTSKTDRAQASHSTSKTNHAQAITPIFSTSPAPPLPARPGQADIYADAPPSYEDAIAQDLPPVDGYRPAYAPPPAGDDILLRRDEKRSWDN